MRLLLKRLARRVRSAALDLRIVLTRLFCKGLAARHCADRKFSRLVTCARMEHENTIILVSLSCVRGGGGSEYSRKNTQRSARLSVATTSLSYALHSKQNGKTESETIVIGRRVRNGWCVWSVKPDTLKNQSDSLTGTFSYFFLARHESLCRYYNRFSSVSHNNERVFFQSVFPIFIFFFQISTRHFFLDLFREIRHLQSSLLSTTFISENWFNMLLRKYFFPEVRLTIVMTTRST